MDCRTVQIDEEPRARAWGSLSRVRATVAASEVLS